MPKFKKILVVCPAGAVTGGPEALHQLVDHMNKLGLPAYITYLPFGKSANTPEPYLRYTAPIADYEDAAGNLIIFPEVYPQLANKVRHAKAAIWWLSLENFLERRHIWPLHDKVRYIKRVIQGKRPLRGARSLKHMIHFSQTQHATDYLKQCGIEPVPLIDSINEDFLNDNHLEFANTKQDIILYNPNKGKKVTDKLIAANPQWQFVPLKGLNREQLSEQLYAAKLYIDFGHHPGRDRMPREAAMHGCCLITGVLGSAGNEIDLPIPKRYKLDSSAPEFVAEFSQLATDILANFAAHYRAFDNYRDYLKNEPKIFRQQISDYFLQTQE
ncbi:hypothetical protein MKLM6_0569 [Methylomonas koyamae]|uniref:Uncharacterized protein n=1 Tax=Methylomonas koyamae TaxID=702114 RepID=A0A291IEU1_9GAMM|nr:hypothetical protein MKLM6_0569 [Methylomonas koyamae]OAI21576.1 hypothetical protein A1356_20595 [Methylomonas koyamae]